MKQLYQKPSIMKDTLVHFESIYTASGTPTIPDPTPSIAPPECNGDNNNGNRNGNHNGNHTGRPHRPGGRG